MATDISNTGFIRYQA